MTREIALVDDEANIRETVGYALEREGYKVHAHADGLAAWEAFQRDVPEVAILDVVMPRMDGFELCRRLRGLSERTAILFLTSRDEEIDRVLGLEIGADDYLGKPFSMRELVARVKVLFRRLSLPAEAPGERVLHAGPLELDLDRFTVRLGGNVVVLTVTEFRILEALVRHPGHVKSRGQLLHEGYPDDVYVSERTIDSHIKRLRCKLEEADPAFQGVETVHGLGYRFHEDRS